MGMLLVACRWVMLYSDAAWGCGRGIEVVKEGVSTSQWRWLML